MCCKVEWRARGDERTRAHAFPGIISARKVRLMEIHALASPGLGVEEGANTRPGEAAEKRENTRTQARAQRLRGDLKREPMWMGSHTKINS